jgi:hypothetical protein
MCYTNLLYSTGKFLETYRLKREEGGGADIGDRIYSIEMKLST